MSDGVHIRLMVSRGKVLEMGRELGLTVREKNFTLTDVYNAEEAFITGTLPAWCR